MFVPELNLNYNYERGLYCTSKVLALCTAVRHLYFARACATWQVNSPCKVNTLHLPRPSMHYSGADTGGQQTPLTTGLHPNSLSSNYTYMSLYSYSQTWITDYHIAAHTPCIQWTYSKATESWQRCSEDRSVTKTCALTILLDQHRCMLQLRSRQPHVLRTVKTHKWSQVLHFTMMFMVAFCFGNFVFSLAINFYWWYIGMNTVSQPNTKQWDMKHIMNTSQRSTAWQIQTIGHISNTFNNNEWSHKMVPKFPGPMQPQVLCQQ